MRGFDLFGRGKNRVWILFDKWEIFRQCLLRWVWRTPTSSRQGKTCPRVSQREWSLCLLTRSRGKPFYDHENLWYFRFRSIAETHYQLGVAQAHCAQSCATKELQCQEYDNAEKSLTSAVAVLNARIASLKKLETSQNITKELAELDLLCKEIQERSADHKEMQKGTYKEDKDFVSIFKGM